MIRELYRFCKWRLGEGKEYSEWECHERYVDELVKEMAKNE